jgi:hypothetical protein
MAQAYRPPLTKDEEKRIVQYFRGQTVSVPAYTCEVGADFRQLFCAQFDVAAEDFEKRLFSMTLFRHSVAMVWLLQRWKPEMFREDYDLMRDLASTVSRGEVVSELNRFYGRNRRVGGFWRNICLCRVSGKRVLNLYRELIREQEEASLAHAVTQS